MKHTELVADYHRVLRIIKNYSLDELDSLLQCIGSYTEMVRAGEGLQPLAKGVPVNLASDEPNGEFKGDSLPANEPEVEPQAAMN